MKQFSIIARPYLYQDLAAATSRLIGAIKDDPSFGDAEDVVGALHKVAASETLIDPAPLVPDVTKALRSLGNARLNKEQKEALERHATIFSAYAKWPEQVGGTHLWNKERHLEAIRDNADYYVQIGRGGAGNYTVGIRYNGEAYWIDQESQWQSFLSNRYDNVLYLNAAYKRYNYIEIARTLHSRVYFKRIDYWAPPLLLPRNVAYSREMGAFFQQIGRDEMRDDQALTINLAAKSDNQPFKEYPFAGWLNPLVLTFGCGQDDLSLSASPKAAEALQLFSSPDLVVHLEPHLDPLEGARRKLFESLSAALLSERSAKSMVEYLFWGSEADSWRAFFFLDTLGGVFYVDGFGEYGFSHMPEPRCYWASADTLSGNEKWLKECFLKLSEHVGEKSLVADMTVARSPVPGFGSPRGHQLVKAAPTDTVFEILRSAIGAPSHTEDERVHLLKELLQAALRFLEEIKDQQDLPGLYFGEGSFRAKREGVYDFDDLAFLETFAKTYLSPRSPLLVRLSPLEKEDAWADLITSVPYGHKGLFEKLTYARLAGFEDENVTDVAYAYGWWQDWFRVLFDRPWKVKINYLAQHGFIVHRSLLGQARLGRARAGGEFDAAEMRI